MHQLELQVWDGPEASALGAGCGVHVQQLVVPFQHHAPVALVLVPAQLRGHVRPLQHAVDGVRVPNLTVYV